MSESREDERRDPAGHDGGDRHSLALELAHKQEQMEMAESPHEHGWKGEVLKLLQKLNKEEEQSRRNEYKVIKFGREVLKALSHPLVLAAIFAPILGYCSNRSLHAYQVRESEFKIIQDQRAKRFADQQAALSTFGDSFPPALALLYRLMDEGLWCEFHKPASKAVLTRPGWSILDVSDDDEFNRRLGSWATANEQFLKGKNPQSLLAQVGALFDSDEVDRATRDLNKTIEGIQNVRDPGLGSYEQRAARLGSLLENANQGYMQLLALMGKELKTKANAIVKENKE